MEVAVKVFKIDPGRTMEKIEKTMRRELLVWLRLKHSTIVPLLGTANVDSPFPALVSQWMSSGTLYKYLEQITMTISAKVQLVGPLFTTITFAKRSSVYATRHGRR
ncbi:hypothetical protein BDR07DRAFT_1401489 [Suillus spraguei]|nr:hypothetical protein BDR07DRAFT_1401489 [Suillus spraguei]